MPEIRTAVSYIRDLPIYQQEKPFAIVLPLNTSYQPKDSRLTNVEFETHHDILVSDIRGREADFRLDNCGFQIVDQNTRKLRFTKSEDMAEYARETELFLRCRFNAAKVVCWDQKLQLRKNGTTLTSPNLKDPLLCLRPASLIHVDHTFTSGQEFTRTYLSESEYAQYNNLGYRFRIVNTWRTLRPIVEDSPLVFCDYRSLDKDDLVVADRVLPTRGPTENYFLKYNHAHKWYWLEHMKPNELLLMLMYDSEDSTKLCPHTSVENPNADLSCPPRYSIESRSLIVTAN